MESSDRQGGLCPLRLTFLLVFAAAFGKYGGRVQHGGIAGRPFQAVHMWRTINLARLANRVRSHTTSRRPSPNERLHHCYSQSMLTFRKPSPVAIRKYLAEQSRLNFSYAAVGATLGEPAAGFTRDHTRSQIGTGEQAFIAATAALQRWEQFRLRWVEAGPADTPIRKGEVVAVLARVGPLWTLNSCRILAVIDDSGAGQAEPVDRFGFAYGTLPGHIEMGEERFLIEWNRSDNSVWYDILAVSKPRHPLVRLGYPLARAMQKRFARDSVAAMKRVVQEAL